MQTGSPLLHLALVKPRIPQNTGNIGRLCLAFGLRLHLVGPLGFETDEKAVRRAGLDYWQHVDRAQHDSLDQLWQALPRPQRVWAFSTRAKRSYTEADYQPGDCLLFGDEIDGLPQAVVDDLGERVVRIPLFSPRVRSLNLANSAAIAVSEAVRQLSAGGLTADPVPPRPRHPAERPASALEVEPSAS